MVRCGGLRLLLLALFTLLAPALALAHAQLVASNPADGAVVASAPAAFTLTFNEPVTPITVKLARPDGSVVLIDTVSTDGPTVIVALPAGLANGSYAISYRVISEDGHPVGGSVVFSIGAPSQGARPTMGDATPQASRLLILAQRVVLYIGLGFGVGGVFASSWIGSGAPDRLFFLRTLLVLGLVSALAGVGLQGLDMLAVSPQALASPAPWRLGLTASYALTLGLADLAMLMALLATMFRSHRLRMALSLGGLVLTGAAIAASGHASAADPQWLMRPTVFVHAVTVCIWVGALAPLSRALAGGDRNAASMLARFSRLILPVVVLLVASGVVLAVVQVRQVEALWTTNYGVVLSVKLCLLMALFAAAGLNRVFLTRPAIAALVETGPLSLRGPLPGKGGEDPRHDPLPRSVRGLRLSILLEILLTIAILLTVANWRFTVPPRALQLAARQAAVVDLMSDKAMAEVTVFPATAGPVAITVMPMAHGADELTIQELSVVLSNPVAGIEPIRRKAALHEDGSYGVDDFTLPVAGTWHVRVEILISDFEMTALEGNVTIGR